MASLQNGKNTKVAWARKQGAQKPSVRVLAWVAGLSLLGGVTSAMADSSESATTRESVAPMDSAFYVDCSHLVFDNFFTEELTRGERITLLNANIEANVGNYQACRSAANEAAQERMVNAGSVGVAENSGAALASETLEALADEPIETTAENEEIVRPAEASRNHSAGSGSGGTSTVCDAIKQGLERASTESEKAHFEKLKNDYGCQ
ncbi:hypothetical protein CWE08_07045 [Aliidiomarina iranensis]|uniref:Uncharacterized protein n=1 Tax=Aliidiomarina iranensis TaxID=1434071 RepID=A0A432VWL4_9GAMM|nr:hypothetical protein [Aliidiomarina iranensis]RUO20851.1 hypothetical protein CWE08_07045 [Aliidiomarina iranensis]